MSYIIKTLEYEITWKNIHFSWKENDLSIRFIEKGYITESYIALNCLFKQNEILLKEIFTVWKENKGEIVKERCSIQKIKKMDYTEYVIWLNDHASKELIFKSGDNEDVDVVGLEIRFLEKNNGFRVFPSVEGYKQISNEITKKF